MYTTSITLAEIRYGIERLPAGRRRDLLKATADELPIDGFDAQIASICHTYNAAVATRNLKDFQDTGIDVIDPWQAAR